MATERLWIGGKTRADAEKTARRIARQDGKTATKISMKVVKTSKGKPYQRYFVTLKTRRRKNNTRDFKG